MEQTEQVNKIKAQLSVFENSCANDYSLYYGKTGLSLVYYMLYAVLNEDTYLVKGKSLIDELSENIEGIEGLSFESGFAGIGWAIEWLVQNKFIETNTDEVLEDMDDELYKAVIYTKSSNLSITNGTIGKALYFYKRLSAKNPHTSRYKHICNQECLVLLIDEINDRLLNEDNQLYGNKISKGYTNLTETGQALLFLASTNHLKINTELSKRSICEITNFLAEYFLSDDFNQDNNDNLYIIYACYKAGKYLKDSNLMIMASDAYHLYVLHHLNKCAESPFQAFIHGKLSGLLNIPLKAGTTVSDSTDNNIFSLLRSVSLLPGASNYNWEEGWGL